jgi:NAD(P)-dependent dehydrogenase (short-subunit alcohol dehydrogenase family)
MDLHAGKETALFLAEAGCKVILAARDMDKANAVVEELQMKSGNTDVEAVVCDLSSLASVQNCVEEIKQRDGLRLRCILNNAGVWPTQQIITDDGMELAFQVKCIYGDMDICRLSPMTAWSWPSR